ITIDELRTLHKVQGKRLLVVVELGLPIADADNYIASDLLTIADEVGEAHRHGHHRRRDVAVGGLVNPFHKVTRVLELDRQEECRGDVVSFHRTTGRVSAATLDLTHPEVEAGRVRLTIQEVVILLPHKYI